MTFHRFIEVCLVIGFLAQTQAIGGIPADVPEIKDVYYTAGFAEDVVTCPDFENKFMICTLTLATSDDDPSILVLQGTIDLNGDITLLHTVSLTVCRYTVAGCELMYTALGNPCETLTDKTTPWYPFLAAFNRDECDILKGSYTVDSMKVSLDYAQDLITHQYVGEYGLQISLMLQEEKLSCYDVIVSVEEKQKN